MKPSRKPAVKRWYRCDYLRSNGDYFYATRAWALEHFVEEARSMTPDSSHYRLAYITVRAVKAPPVKWLADKRIEALEQAKGYEAHADFLRTELTRHYLGHK